MGRMRTARAIAALVVCCGGASAPLAAQNPPRSPVFKSTTSLVALNIIVTDINKEYASGLSRGDFEVYEDGVRQEVEFFAAAGVPIDLILLIDGSSSMSEKVPFVQKAAGGFIETLRADDRAAIVSFADGVRVLQPLTTDRAKVAHAIDQTGARGATALHNAIYVALKEFGRPSGAAGAEVRRQVIAVLSDGEDTSSVLTFDDVLDMAKRSGVSIYTIGLRDTRGPRDVSARRYFSQADFAMKQLAVETGAKPFFPERADELGRVYAAIATELASQYSIGYVPSNVRTDGKYRRVVVRVANRPELTSRTRTGYFLAAGSSTLGVIDHQR